MAERRLPSGWPVAATTHRGGAHARARPPAPESGGLWMRVPARSWVRALALPAALGLSACQMSGVDWQNRQAAEQAARQAAPPGSTALGWRIYQQRCADCHGAAATGGDRGPDLSFRLRDIGPQRFVDLVLRRYDWDLGAGGAGSPRETLVDDVVERRRGEVQMPAWQGEPLVSAHIMDLYAYLAGRADGRIGPGRPLR
jgi:mono/diheme cytochrome c family protein